MTGTKRWRCALAEKEGVGELASDRLEIINFLRDHYKKYRFFPLLGSICKDVHQPKDCVVEKFMDPLTACKVAGLPKPNRQVTGYLKGEGGVVYNRRLPCNLTAAKFAAGL
jgi:sulfur relay (sulfurtransferase) DsrC/TusE family protein